jgi:hypothetical protein
MMRLLVTGEMRFAGGLIGSGRELAWPRFALQAGPGPGNSEERGQQSARRRSRDTYGEDPGVPAARQSDSPKLKISYFKRCQQLARYSGGGAGGFARRSVYLSVEKPDVAAMFRRTMRVHFLEALNANVERAVPDDRTG